MPPKPLQPQLRLVEVHPGEVRLSLAVEGPVAEKVLQGSKASKNKNSFSWMTPKFYQDFATTKKDDEISRQKRKKHFYKLQRLAAIFFLTFFLKKKQTFLPPLFISFSCLSPLTRAVGQLCKRAFTFQYCQSLGLNSIRVYILPICIVKSLAPKVQTNQ